MTRPISETDLILPALYCIRNAGEITTTELSKCLRELLKPQGEDLEILQNVVPVCSNCHRMIHRKGDRMLSVDELKQMIADSENSG